MCDAAVRMKRNQAQLYLNLAEVYISAGRKEDAREALFAGMKYARRDIRLNIAMAKLTPRRAPVFTFLERKHPLNRHFGCYATKRLVALRQRIVQASIYSKPPKTQKADGFSADPPFCLHFALFRNRAVADLLSLGIIPAGITALKSHLHQDLEPYSNMPLGKCIAAHDFGQIFTVHCGRFFRVRHRDEQPHAHFISISLD